MATGKVNVGSGGSGINIFTQLSEPSTKEGIWIQTDIPYKNVVSDSEIWFAGEWNDPDVYAYPKIPEAMSNSAVYDTVVFDNKLYTIFIRNTSCLLYSFDLINRVWTMERDLYNPASAFHGIYGKAKLYLKGEYIYIIGTQNTTNAGALFYKGIHKYHIPTKTLSYVTAMLRSVVNTMVTRIGDIIYITPDEDFFKQYKFNLDDDSLIEGSITPALSRLSGNTSETLEGYTYLVLNNQVRKYDPILNISETISTMPADTGYPPSLFLHGKYLYLVPSGGNRASIPFRRYDTVNKVWETIESPFRAGVLGSVISFFKIDESRLGLFDATTRNFFIRDFKSKQYPDDTVVLFKPNNHRGNYLTELSTPYNKPNNIRLLTGFDNIYMHLYGTLNKNLPSYYGDGVKWIKFKN